MNLPRNRKPPAARLATANASKSGSTVTATIDGIETTIETARDLIVANGDVLFIVPFGSQWFAVALAYTAAPAAQDNDPAPPAKPASVSGRLVCAPVETRSYRNGSWRSDNDDVYQGEYGGNGNHTGVAFYGTKPQSLSGATVTAAHLKVRRPSKGGAASTQSTTMRLVTQARRPAGAPTLTSSTAGPSLRWGQTNNAFVVPTAWAQALVDGTAGGLGFYDVSGSPYVIFDGRSAWSPAFSLILDWSR